VTRTLIRGIGTLISGDVRSPLMKQTRITIDDGRIVAIGDEAEPEGVDQMIDANGSSVAPGLWDSHYHPYFGDYSPRQEAGSTVTRTVKAGVTSMVSAGAGHQPGMYLPSPNLPNVQAVRASKGQDPGRARDARGSKALAISMHRAWLDYRPMGAKVYAGTVLAEDGFTRDDFVDMAEQGIRMLKFLRPVSRMSDAIAYRNWAAEVGMLVMTHTGNRPVTKDSSSITRSLQDVHPDIAGHINGGPTPAPREAIEWFVESTDAALDTVFIGNMRVAVNVVRRIVERDELERILIGSDLPGGTGIVPTAVLRTVQLLHQFTELPAALLVCMATGNTARANRLPGGLIAVGEPADLVFWDAADGSESDSFLDSIEQGDRPYPGLVMIDGEIVEHGNPLLLEPKRMPTVQRVTRAEREAREPVGATA
jgi:enamidase